MTEPVSAFDPVKYKTTTRAQWDATAEAWNRWSGLLGSNGIFSLPNPAGFEGPRELVVAVGTK